MLLKVSVKVLLYLKKKPFFFSYLDFEFEFVQHLTGKILSFGFYAKALRRRFVSHGPSLLTLKFDQ